MIRALKYKNEDNAIDILREHLTIKITGGSTKPWRSRGHKMKLLKLPIVQITILLLLIIQIGFTQEKALVIHNDNGSISTIKISDIDTLKFTENFMEDIAESLNNIRIV